MTDWTMTVQKDGAEYSMNATGTHITVSTIHGSYTESVERIRVKLNDPDLLPAVRSMFQSMMRFYQENRK